MPSFRHVTVSRHLFVFCSTRLIVVGHTESEIRNLYNWHIPRCWWNIQESHPPSSGAFSVWVCVIASQYMSAEATPHNSCTAPIVLTERNVGRHGQRHARWQGCRLGEEVEILQSERQRNGLLHLNGDCLVFFIHVGILSELDVSWKGSCNRLSSTAPPPKMWIRLACDQPSRHKGVREIGRKEKWEGHFQVADECDIPYLCPNLRSPKTWPPPLCSRWRLTLQFDSNRDRSFEIRLQASSQHSCSQFPVNRISWLSSEFYHVSQVIALCLFTPGHVPECPNVQCPDPLASFRNQTLCLHLAKNNSCWIVDQRRLSSEHTMDG